MVTFSRFPQRLFIVLRSITMATWVETNTEDVLVGFSKPDGLGIGLNGHHARSFHPVAREALSGTPSQSTDRRAELFHLDPTVRVAQIPAASREAACPSAARSRSGFCPAPWVTTHRRIRRYGRGSGTSRRTQS